MAAISAAEHGARVLLLEKNRKPGVKILMSGGTRCNITHATDNRGIVAAYGPPGRFLHSALAALSVQDTHRLFRGGRRRHQGRGDGQDLSRQQQGARRAERLARAAATQRRHAWPWKSHCAILIVREPGFALTTPRRVVSTRRVILTTGGQSYPGSGTTGDGYALAAKFGHTIVPPRPALVPITTTCGVGRGTARRHAAERRRPHH